jgi:hypothetical protein
MITLETSHARTSAPSHSGQRCGSRLIINSSVANNDGPATYGIANGTMNGSPVVFSCSDVSAEGKTIRKAIKNRITPPAIVKAGSEICNTCSRNRPAKRKKIITTKAMSSSRTTT